MREEDLRKTTASDRLAPPIPRIPWNRRETWDEANASLAWTLWRAPSAMAPARAIAGKLHGLLGRFSPELDRLCRLSCPWCPDPCCLRAKVWFDFNDLLFLHLSGQDIPPGQPITAWDQSCAYLGPRGCTLPRFARPWICSWYLCPPQRKLIVKNPLSFPLSSGTIIHDIKQQRRAMAAAFIRAVT